MEADAEGSEERAGDDEPPTQAAATTQDVLVRSGAGVQEEQV